MLRSTWLALPLVLALLAPCAAADDPPLKGPDRPRLPCVDSQGLHMDGNCSGSVRLPREVADAADEAMAWADAAQEEAHARKVCLQRGEIC